MKHYFSINDTVPQDSESLKKDEIDKNMIERRRAMETVHQQLLIIETPFTQMRDVDPPNTSEESVADQSTSSKEKKLSMGRRFLKFFGLRNIA
uniref:Uncharacterized protein n=1 Tax=Magallana gigas TaxID=29159 RepID=K1PMK9_MAGGI